MVDTKKFIGNNIRVVKTNEGLKGFISVDDCRELLTELEQCYSEIADKEAIIKELHDYKQKHDLQLQKCYGSKIVKL